MNREKHGRGAAQAWEMIAAFSSFGVDAFDLTETGLDGQKYRFRPAQSGEQLRRCLAEWIEAAAEHQHNLIVRPHKAQAILVQLDDLGEAALARVRSASFLILCTSPGNHQAWVAIGDCGPDFARRLRRGSGADASASGAARVAGSINFKRKYAPHFPTVILLEMRPQHMTTQAELQALGLVAQPTPQIVTPRRVSFDGRAPAWPSYERCVFNAPLAHGTERPDISRADFTFCLLAIDWGWGVAQVAERLMLHSRKARENGESYALRTAERAAAAIARRRCPLWNHKQLESVFEAVVETNGEPLWSPPKV
jgi:RepB DNA-primase from phage plasmid